MGFNWYARKARRPEIPLHIRRCALRSCIRRLSLLTGERYTQAVARYDTRFNFNPRKSTERELLAALAAVESERNQILERVRAFERRRIREKMRGNRNLSEAHRRAWSELTQIKG